MARGTEPCGNLRCSSHIDDIANQSLLISGQATAQVEGATGELLVLTQGGVSDASQCVEGIATEGGLTKH